MIYLRWVSLVLVMVFYVNGSHGAPLEPRYGGIAYYDPDINTTFMTNTSSQGAVTWQAATDWAAGLDVGGVTGWGLPFYLASAANPCDDLCQQTRGYFSYLYHVRDITPATPGPFTNVSGQYWTSNYFFEGLSGSYTNTIYDFSTGLAISLFASDDNRAQAWAYIAGDPLNGLTLGVSPVPLPAAAWLFGPVVIGLFGASRRKRSK